MSKKDTVLYYECDERQFHRDFESHLSAAKGLAIVLSPFIEELAVDNYLKLFRILVVRGQRVCVFAQQPQGWKRRHEAALSPELRKACQTFEANVQRLRAVGVHVTIRRKVHIKAYIIDEFIVWTGSMNALSHKDNEESMTYFNSRSHVARLIARFRLDTCEECGLNPEYSLFKSKRPSLAERVRLLWDKLGMRRKQLGLKQAAISRHAGISSSYLSEMVAGKRDAKLKVILQICDALNYELVVVPRYLVPAVTDLMSGHLESMEGTSASGNSLEMIPEVQKQFGEHEILDFDMKEIRKKL